jgi:hypothetical protein
MSDIVIHSDRNYSNFYINPHHISLIIPIFAENIREFVKNANRVDKENRPSPRFWFGYFTIMLLICVMLVAIIMLRTYVEFAVWTCGLIILLVVFLYMSYKILVFERRRRQALISLAVEAEELMKPFYKISSFISEDASLNFIYENNYMAFRLTTNFVFMQDQDGKQNVVVIDRPTTNIVQYVEQPTSNMPTAKPNNQSNDIQTPLFVCETKEERQEDAEIGQQQSVDVSNVREQEYQVHLQP